MAQISRIRLLAARGVFVLAALVAFGCGGSEEAEPTPAPAATAVATQPPQAAGVPGTVTASMATDCILRSDGTAEIIVEYGAKATNDSRVGRVRLFVEDAILEDSGLLNDVEYQDREVIPAAPGSERQIRVEATPSGGEGRAAVRTTVRCPTAPGQRN